MKGYVRFGSKADMCSANLHVRFAPNSDRENGFPHKVMSTLPPKADMCGALAHVCFGPIADIKRRCVGTVAMTSPGFGAAGHSITCGKALRVDLSPT